MVTVPVVPIDRLLGWLHFAMRMISMGHRSVLVMTVSTAFDGISTEISWIVDGMTLLCVWGDWFKWEIGLQSDWHSLHCVRCYFKRNFYWNHQGSTFGLSPRPAFGETLLSMGHRTASGLHPDWHSLQCFWLDCSRHIYLSHHGRRAG